MTEPDTPTAIKPSALSALARPSLCVLRLFPLLALAVLAWALDHYGPRLAPPGAQLAVINVWVQVALLVVSALLSYALAPKPAQPPKPTLEDFDLPTADEGRAIPVVFGEVWISGPNILWYGDLDTTPIKVKGGKK